MTNIPVDSKNVDNDTGHFPNSSHISRLYCYQVSADGRGYRLGACLESMSSGDPNYFDGSEEVRFL